jgi:hypothetical protein
MVNTFEAGEKITIAFFAGKTLDVVVDHDMGEAVLICSPDEYERAHREGRQPASVKYPKDYVRSCCPSASNAEFVEAATNAT